MREGGLRGWVGGIAIGLLMGIAERIPGASAASVALALGVYAALLAALCGQSRRTQVGEVGLAIGCAIGLFISLAWGSAAVAALFIHDAVPVRAFFFGVIAAAVFLSAAGLRRWGFAALWLIVFGVLAGTALTRAAPDYLPGLSAAPIAIALVGACAALLPGGFGNSLLAVSGVADAATAAWLAMDVRYLALLVLGATAGLLLCANVLWRALRRFPDETNALLLGLMGSGLARLWPWQRIDAYTLTSRGDAAALSTSPLLPWHYFATTGAEVNGLMACAAMASAAALVVLVQRMTWQPAPT